MAVVIESDDEDDLVQLQKQGLEQIPKSVAQNNGASAGSLDLTSNRIRTGANLEYFVNLHTLILDKNDLSELVDFPVMGSLETLWLNNNNFSDMKSLLMKVQELFPNLTYLSLLRNPICPQLYFEQGNEEQYRRYRTTVICKLPKLVFLDAITITQEEKEYAVRAGEFLVNVAKVSDKEYDRVNTDSAEDLEALKHQHTEANQKPSAYLGRGKIKYDGRQSEGNRFIGNEAL